MVAINTVMGTLTAYVLVRYEFAGKSLLNAVVDVPLAIPTLVTGVMLVILYGPQEALGAWLEHTLGLRIIFAPPGIILALLFVTFPFVVRAVQPVLLGLDRGWKMLRQLWAPGHGPFFGASLCRRWLCPSPAALC